MRQHAADGAGEAHPTSQEGVTEEHLSTPVAVTTLPILIVSSV